MIENLLASPRTSRPLRFEEGRLAGGAGESYPVVAGIPVLLRDDVPQTIGIATTTLDYAAGRLSDAAGRFLDSLGISSEEKAMIESLRGKSAIDPVVSVLIGATNGIAYRELIGKLDRYPIPDLPLAPARGRPLLLDIGCNWGRWCVAAAKKGYRAVGVDPSLGALAAAGRVAKELGVDAEFVAGDGRHLPFKDGTFDVVFSYSTIQHLSKENARKVFAEIARVLKPGGRCVVEMPNRWGLRCLYHQARRGFRKTRDFEVRYWGPDELVRAFAVVGPAKLSVDCFFGIGLQKNDLALMPPKARAAVRASEALKVASRALPPLTRVADSLFVEAVKAT